MDSFYLSKSLANIYKLTSEDIPTRIYISLVSKEFGWKIASTRLKSKSPISPQLIPPIMLSTSVLFNKIFMFASFFIINLPKYLHNIQHIKIFV